MNFTLKDKVWMSDKNCDALVFQHPSGLRHIHLQTKFPELCFNVSLPTATIDDTGMPHILEHMIMCGSQDYPQNDPFFSMTRRSVAHDLNASTDRSITSYHFATTDQKDFDNLAALYLDLVYRPLLRVRDFLREGWRLEQGADGKPKLNGVVLNEMMGVYGHGGRHLYEAAMMIIGQGTPAAKMSGGHPLSITALDYENLKNFYSSRYFYGKSVIVTAGQIDLDQFHERVLETISKIPQQDTRELVENGIGRGIGVNPHNNFELGPKEVLENGTSFQSIAVPGQPNEPMNAVWLWRGDYRHGSLNELYDQSIAGLLFSDDNPAYLKLCRDTGFPWQGFPLFHGLARHGGTIGIIMVASGVSKEDIASLDARVKLFFEESVLLGIDPHSWEHKLDQTTNGISEYSPSHQMVHSVAELAVSNLPIDSDANNLVAARTLIDQGPPNEQQLREWLSRFESLGVLMSQPDPELINRWQAQLDLIAQQKADAGVPFTRPEDISGKNPDDDILPQVTVAELSPQIQPMSSIKVIPAVKLDQPNLAALTDEARAMPDMTSLWVEGLGFDPGKEGDERTASIIHIHSPEDEKSMFLQVIFDYTDFTSQDNLNLKLLDYLENRLGVNGQTPEERLQQNVREKLTVGYSQNTLTENPGQNRNLFSIIAHIVEPTVGTKHAASALMRHSILNLNDDDFTNAIQQVRRILEGRAEKIRREEQRNELLSSIVASEAGEKEHLVKIDTQLEYLAWALKNLPQAIASMQDTVDKLFNTAPRVIKSVGDDRMLEQALHASHLFASCAPAWEMHKQNKPWMPGNSGRGYIYEPGGHKVYRHFSAPLMREDVYGMMAVHVMANMASEFLHTEIREKGGAYGSGMQVKNHSIVLMSQDDPSPDQAYEAFRKLPDHLRQLFQQQDPDVLEQARIGVARSLVNPGNGKNGLSSANSNVYLWKRADRTLNHLEVLQRISWDDIGKAINLIDPAFTPFQDITSGPTSPKPLPGKPKLRHG